MALPKAGIELCNEPALCFLVKRCKERAKAAGRIYAAFLAAFRKADWSSLKSGDDWPRETYERT
jgi:hypothetical protein